MLFMQRYNLKRRRVVRENTQIMFPIQTESHFFRESKYIDGFRHLVSKIKAARKALGIICEEEIRKEVGYLLNRYKVESK